MQTEYQLRELELVVRERAEGSKPITNDVQVVEWAKDTFGEKLSEHFVAIGLDGRSKPTGWWLVSKGTQTASLVHPREVFAPAVQTACVGLLVIHNHPSGDCTPSAEDGVVTRRLAEAGELLGIRLMDHIIVASYSHYGFRANQPELFATREGLR